MIWRSLINSIHERPEGLKTIGDGNDEVMNRLQKQAISFLIGDSMSVSIQRREKRSDMACKAPADMVEV